MLSKRRQPTVLLIALLSITTLPLGARSDGARLESQTEPPRVDRPQSAAAGASHTAALPLTDKDSLGQELSARLRELGFTGKVESTLETRLGRRVDPARANLGRLLWFDTISGLNNDNTCAGCHSPRADSATRNPLPSALITTASSAPIAAGRAINGAPPWRSTRRSIRT